MIKLKIFISHSSKDEILAGQLVDLFLTALNLASGEIRCSSIGRHKIKIGDKIKYPTKVGSA